MGADTGAVDEAGIDVTGVKVAGAPLPPLELHAAINNASAIRLEDSVARDGGRTNAAFTNTSSIKGVNER